MLPQCKFSLLHMNKTVYASAICCYIVMLSSLSRRNKIELNPDFILGKPRTRGQMSEVNYIRIDNNSIVLR